jgi:hypothetical protein
MERASAPSAKPKSGEGVKDSFHNYYCSNVAERYRGLKHANHETVPLSIHSPSVPIEQLFLIRTMSVGFE